MQAYKDNLVYNPTWKNEYYWMDYDSTQNVLVCTICKVHGKPPVQAKGTWVTRPIKNWVKAKSLLIQHEKCDLPSQRSKEWLCLNQQRNMIM